MKTAPIEPSPRLLARMAERARIRRRRAEGRLRYFMMVYPLLKAHAESLRRNGLVQESERTVQ